MTFLTNLLTRLLLSLHTLSPSWGWRLVIPDRQMAGCLCSEIVWMDSYPAMCEMEDSSRIRGWRNPPAHTCVSEASPISTQRWHGLGRSETEQVLPEGLQVQHTNQGPRMLPKPVMVAYAQCRMASLAARDCGRSWPHLTILPGHQAPNLWSILDSSIFPHFQSFTKS